ncbi:hypothetical protein ID866_10285 [Astraeus odoratus]|nr:hypothetical protein ID866_10285 [Astraeus odoratus]
MEAEGSTSWNDQLAEKYYNSLYREFAVCNLKHYKSGNFALRWRTENEVLDGTGETTCANMRCKHHRTPSTSSLPLLTTLELPFTYEEHGERKQALVKVVLCPKCVRKLMWKRTQEKRLVEKEDTAEHPKDGHSDGHDKCRQQESDEDSGEDRRPKCDDSRSRKRQRSHSRPISPEPHKRMKEIVRRDESIQQRLGSNGRRKH